MNRADFNARETMRKIQDPNYEIFSWEDQVFDILQSTGGIMKREEIISKILPKADLTPADRDLASECVQTALKKLKDDGKIESPMHGHYRVKK